MNIKTITKAALLCFFALACKKELKPKAEPEINKELPKYEHIELLQGYFIKNTIEIPKLKCIVFTTKEEFENIFGIAKTMNNTISTIDFNSFSVGAIIDSVSAYNTTIKIENTMLNQDRLTIDFNIQKGNNRQSYETTPQLLFKFKKDSLLKMIEYKTIGKTQMIHINQ